MLKKLFCKHIYKKIAKRKSNYCSDYTTFSDLGDYEDILYECKNCGKIKIKTFNVHLHNEWKQIKG
jgi:hypothetical protein